MLGRGAGRHKEGWGGCLIFDDPHPLEDVRYDTKRKNTLNTINNLVTSRRNNPDETPVVGIMQRLHEEDWVGYINENELEDWEIIKIPVFDDDRNILWPGFSPSRKKLERMEATDPYQFYSQYMQEPTPVGGSVFKQEWWKFYENEPDFIFRFATADTAQKTGEHNDYSVVQCWGYCQKDQFDDVENTTKKSRSYLFTRPDTR